jgi:hypothetical protein
MSEGESRIPEEEKLRSELESLRSQVRSALSEVRKNLGKGQGFAERLLASVSPFIEAGIIGEGAEERLRAAADMDDDAASVEASLAALESAIELKVMDPKRYEEIRSGGEARDKNVMPLNELLTYEIDGGTVRLHVPDNTGRPPLELMASIGDGLRKLAAIVREHNASGEGEPITRIMGTSWIVASAPALMKRFGFVLNGQVSEELRRAHFSDEIRQVHEAEMSSEELLRRYG